MEKVGKHSKVQDIKNSKLEKKNINKKSNKKDKNDSKSKIILMNLEWLENIKIRKKKRNLKKH